LPDIKPNNPIDYHVWGETKPKTNTEVKEAFKVIWDNLPQAGPSRATSGPGETFLRGPQTFS